MEDSGSGTIKHLTFAEQIATLNRTEKRKVLKRYGMLKPSRAKGGNYMWMRGNEWQ